MALDKQINLFKVDTNAFLSDIEIQDGIYLKELKNYYSNLKTCEKKLKSSKDENDKYDLINLKEKIKSLEEEIKWAKKLYKSVLLDDAEKAVESNKQRNVKKIRVLDESYIYYTDREGNKNYNTNNIVSMFESSLSRSFDILTNELTTDIFIVEIYYYDIAQDLILNGFDYNNKHYVYFSSSAGQIRTKKAVFVEEEKYKMC